MGEREEGREGGVDVCGAPVGALGSFARVLHLPSFLPLASLLASLLVLLCDSLSPFNSSTLTLCVRPLRWHLLKAEDPALFQGSHIQTTFNLAIASVVP